MILKVLRTMKGNMWNLIRKQIHTAYTLAVVGAWTASDFLCFFWCVGETNGHPLTGATAKDHEHEIEFQHESHVHEPLMVNTWTCIPLTQWVINKVQPNYYYYHYYIYIYYIYWHILSVFCFLNLLSVMQPQHIAMHMWPWFPSDLRGAFQWTCGLHWIAHDCITWILPGVVEWLVSGIYPLIYIYMDVVECIPKYILSLFFGNTDYQTISGCI